MESFIGLLTRDEVLVYAGVEKYKLKLAYGDRHQKNYPVLVVHDQNTKKWTVYEDIEGKTENFRYEVREVSQMIEQHS